MATKIPLKCDICPKKPRFSDVSHLLTHISSKTHLSNIFKAKLRADADTNSRRLIEDYDQWYAEWNIHDLLAERVSLKEKKHTKSKPRGNRASTPASTSRSNRSTMATDEPTFGSQQQNPRQPQHVDPDLIARTPASQLPPLQFSHPPYHFAQPSVHHGYNGVNVFRPYNRANFSSTPVSSQMQMTRGIAPPRGQYHYPDPSEAHNGAQSTATAYMAPNTRKRKATTGAGSHFLRSAVRRVKEEDASYEPTEVSTTIDSDEDEDDDAKPVPLEPDPETDAITVEGDPFPNVKVKGVYWDGMGCFDSADPKKRSQRNQKKTDHTYQELERFSELIANNPYDAVYEVSEDGHWIVTKCRLITGNPTPSSLAGSSPAPSRRQSPRRATRNTAVLNQREVNQQAVAGYTNQRTEYDLQQAVLGLRHGRTMSVFNDNDDDIETRSNYTCPNRPQPSMHTGFRATLSLNKENERELSQTPALTTKADEEGADSGIQLPLNSIEQPGYEDEEGPYTTPRGQQAEERGATLIGQGHAGPQRMNLFQQANIHPEQAPNQSQAFSGSNTSHQSEPVRLTGTPSDYLIPGGAIRDHGYVSSFHSAPPGVSSMQDIHSRFPNAQFSNTNNYRLDNLAAVAQTHLQYPQQGPPSFQTSPYGRTMPAFHGFSHSPTAGIGSSLHFGQSLDGTWNSQHPGAPGFPPSAFHFRRPSNQAFGMPQQSPPPMRAPDFTNPHNHQMTSTDEKPSNIWVDGSHGSPSATNSGTNQAPQTFNEQFNWNFERFNSNTLQYPESFAMSNIFDVHANQSAAVQQTTAISQPQTTLTFLAPIRSEAVAAGLATPAGGAMKPPPPPGSTGRRTRAASRASSNTPSRPRGRPRGSTKKARGRSGSRAGSSTGGSKSSHHDLPNPVAGDNNETLGESVSTASSDENRTVTAPPTPSKGNTAN